MAFFTGYDLYNASYVPTRDLLDELGSGGDEFDTAIGDIEAEIGFDLEDDLLSLMTGEYAVAFNARGFDSEEPEFDVLAMIDVNDREKIASTMERVGNSWSSRTSRGLRMDSRGCSAVVHRCARERGLDAGRRHAGRRIPRVIGQGFLDGVDGSLADSADWKRTMELMPENKTSLFYVSLARVIEEVREDRRHRGAVRDVYGGGSDTGRPGARQDAGVGEHDGGGWIRLPDGLFRGGVSWVVRADQTAFVDQTTGRIVATTVIIVAFFLPWMEGQGNSIRGRSRALTSRDYPELRDRRGLRFGDRSAPRVGDSPLLVPALAFNRAFCGWQRHFGPPCDPSRGGACDRGAVSLTILTAIFC